LYFWVSAKIKMTFESWRLVVNHEKMDFHHRDPITYDCNVKLWITKLIHISFFSTSVCWY
jgi:hypothetical protein